MNNFFVLHLSWGKENELTYCSECQRMENAVKVKNDG